MAYLIARNVSNMTRRGFFSSSVRAALPEEFPDMMKVVTGLEKKELEANLAGKDDRFDVQTIPRGPSSLESPTLIASAYESRVVGCICTEESASINWMWLKKGGPQQCACGHYFQLVQTHAAGGTLKPDQQQLQQQ